MVINDLFLSVIFLAFISLFTVVVIIITILILTFYRRRHRHHASDVVVVADTDLPSFFPRRFRLLVALLRRFISSDSLPLTRLQKAINFLFSRNISPTFFRVCASGTTSQLRAFF